MGTELLGNGRLQGLIKEKERINNTDMSRTHLPALQLAMPLPLLPPPRRSRSEKKPTPEDQKDQRYLERRRRNNRAAKKSRDARRVREDQVILIT